MLPLPKFSIIVPVYNRYDLTNRFLFDLYKQVPNLSDGEVVICSDGSTDETLGGLNFWKQSVFKNKNFQVHHSEENHGFGMTNNTGAELARSDNLIFMNNDILIHENFIPKIMAILVESERQLIGSEVYRTDVGWNKFGNYVVPYVAGHFIVCQRKVWNELGGFDLRYGKATYEDIDLSMTAITKGIKLTQCQLNLQHLGGQTMAMDEKRLALTKNNRAIFEKKWGRVLPEIMEKYYEK